MANGYYEDGTITVALNGTAVTGVGTAFSLRVRVGDRLMRNGFSVPIAGPTTDGKTITSNTSLVLEWGFPAALTGSTYMIELLPDLTRNLEALESYIELMGGPNIDALAALDGTGGGLLPRFTGAGVMDVISYAALLTAIGGQPSDADLTAIAALTTTAFGRSLLTPADAAAARTLIGASARQASTALDTTTDLDTLVTAGPHDKLISGNPNAPDAAFYYLDVWTNAGGNVTQRLTPYGIGGAVGSIHLRSRFGGAWSAWRRTIYRDEAPALVTAAADNRVLRSDGTGGQQQGSGVTLSDANDLSGLATVTVTSATSAQWLQQLTSPDRGLLMRNTAAAGFFLFFQNNAVATIGSISHNRSAVTYSTTSDERIKNVHGDVESEAAFEAIMGLRPVWYDYKDDASSETRMGFLAHEAQQVMPWAVMGQPADVDVVWTQPDDGDDWNTFTPTRLEYPRPQMMDYSQAVPIAVAAIRAEIAKREALEASIADLAIRLALLEV